jgi:eukaryotic-like serine/threonine-protein kinase
MLAEAQSDRLAGVVLGGAYRLVGCIGQGGMGAVYEAHHLRLQKRVAVKLMNRAIASNEEALARFHREASVASRLGHPHLVNVVDFGTSHQGEPYLVMEHLEGEDLDRRIHRARTVPLGTAVEITRQVASALAAVHAKGIVHRDLKPANIFLVQVPGEPDFVKVLDFGVSKMKAARTKLTADSSMVGTPKYMSPEQASGSNDEVDHRADQWALACIVWEMLTGTAPFDADDIQALFFRLVNLPPAPLSKSAPDLPSAVEPVLLRALSKRPADRYASIREFARAFQTAAVGSWTELTPMPFRRAESEPWRLSTVAGARSPSPESDSAGDEGGVFATPAGTPRRSNLRLAMAGLAVAIAVSGVGLLFANARTATSVQAPMLVAGATSAPVVSTLPAVPRSPILQAKSSTSAAPTPVGRAKAKVARRPSSADPFDDGGPDRNATAKRAGTSEERNDRQGRLPRRERHIFEEL